MTRRFTARTAGIEVPGLGEIPPYWVRVVVHDTDQEMRRAFAKLNGESVRNVDEALIEHLIPGVPTRETLCPQEA